MRQHRAAIHEDLTFVMAGLDPAIQTTAEDWITASGLTRRPAR
jgi:hypothetical protein